jgi:hypothetical protein
MHTKQNFALRLGVTHGKQMLHHYGSSMSRSDGPHTLELHKYMLQNPTPPPSQPTLCASLLCRATPRTSLLSPTLCAAVSSLMSHHLLLLSESLPSQASGRAQAACLWPVGWGFWQMYRGVGDSPRGPLKQRGNPHLKPTTRPKHNLPNHAGNSPRRRDSDSPSRRPS